MFSSLEQLKTLELSANFTPRERKYFYKLRDELEAIVGGVSIEKLNKPSDVAQLKRIRAKLEEILKFIQDREMEVEVWGRERFMEWVEEFHLENKLTDEWVDKNIEFRDDVIICKKDLILSRTDITYLPNNLSVAGYLDLSRCTSLVQLPDNLTVVSNVDLRDCTSLTYLPDNLTFLGDLNLCHCTSLTQLPDNLQIGRNLDLSGCTALTHLPDGLGVKASCDLSGCTELKHLPDDIQIGSSLTISVLSTLRLWTEAMQLKKRGQIKGEIERK